MVASWKVTSPMAMSPVEEAYGIGHGVLNVDAERYNLAGIPLDLYEVYPSTIHIGDIYEDSTARWCYIPLSHDSGVSLQADFLFTDDQLAAAYVIVYDFLMPSYLHDAGITDPPPSFLAVRCFQSRSRAGFGRLGRDSPLTLLPGRICFPVFVFVKRR